MLIGSTNSYTSFPVKLCYGEGFCLFLIGDCQFYFCKLRMQAGKYWGLFYFIFFSFSFFPSQEDELKGAVVLVYANKQVRMVLHLFTFNLWGCDCDIFYTVHTWYYHHVICWVQPLP